MKKVLSVLLAVCLLLGALPVIAAAEWEDGVPSVPIIVQSSDGANYWTEYSADGELPPSTYASSPDGSQSGLPKLSNPTNLRWEPDGRIDFDINGKFQEQAKLCFYEVSSTEAKVELVIDYSSHVDSEHIVHYEYPYFIYYTHIGKNYTSTDDSSELNINTYSDLSSGTYYFTVQLLGDGKQYQNSDIISSKDFPNGTFQYTKPKAKLTAVDKGTWAWPMSHWKSKSDNAGRVWYYFVEYGFSETAGGEIRLIGGSFSVPEIGGIPQTSIDNNWLQEKLIGDHGAGYYYFRVQAITNDIFKQQNSDYSPWSDGYNLLEVSTGITAALKELSTETDASVIKKAVQDMNTNDLANAMRADMSNISVGAVNALADLETKLGTSAGVEVDDKFAESFQPDKISVVGAGLNNKTDEKNDITLNVGPAKQANHVRDEMYNNTVAVDFSMDLDNVTNTKSLDVPVKITMPIPSDINPDFLVVLHYRLDGTYEKVWTHQYQDKNGQWYVSFVLTSFSDFTMTMTNSPDTPAQRFSDIKTTDWFYDAVEWAVQNGITSGKGSTTTFKPNDTCTRAEIMTFIWASEGKPDPTSAAAFSDMPTLAAFRSAISWAVEKGVTGGIGGGKFGTTAPCTRVQAVTFLWAAAGKPQPSTPAMFSDMTGNQIYDSAISWAVENQITSGAGNNRFDPNKRCTRAEIVTFLHKAYQ